MEPITTYRPDAGIIERTHYDERDKVMVSKVTYDNTEILARNAIDRNAAPDQGRYKGNLVHVGRLHEGDIQRLKNMGYNLMSPDPAEVRRALLYVQSNEPALLTVPGKPFAATRAKWV